MKIIIFETYTQKKNRKEVINIDEKTKSRESKVDKRLRMWILCETKLFKKERDVPSQYMYVD